MQGHSTVLQAMAMGYLGSFLMSFDKTDIVWWGEISGPNILPNMSGHRFLLTAGPGITLLLTNAGCTFLGVSINGGAPIAGWFLMKNGVPLFQENLHILDLEGLKHPFDTYVVMKIMSFFHYPNDHV